MQNAEKTWLERYLCSNVIAISQWCHHKYPYQNIVPEKEEKSINGNARVFSFLKMLECIWRDAEHTTRNLILS